MGPEGIPFAQGLLQQGPAGIQSVNQAYSDIAAIAEKTADSLTNRFFGDKIADLRGDVKDQKAVLVDIKQSVRFLEKVLDQDKIVINISGWVGSEPELAKKLRDELGKLGRHNVTAGIP